MATRRIALLRGINVGGRNKLPMADLRAAAEGLGWDRVETHLGSGNLLFAAPGKPAEQSRDLARAIAAAGGPDVKVIIVTRTAMRQAVAACPFDPEDPHHVHVLFLSGAAAIDMALFERMAADGDALEHNGTVAWLHTPDGMGTSKLGKSIERVLGCPATARNLSTAQALAAKA